jgi:hypothetical protein
MRWPLRTILSDRQRSGNRLTLAVVSEPELINDRFISHCQEALRAASYLAALPHCIHHGSQPKKGAPLQAADAPPRRTPPTQAPEAKGRTNSTSGNYKWPFAQVCVVCSLEHGVAPEGVLTARRSARGVSWIGRTAAGYLPPASFCVHYEVRPAWGASLIERHWEERCADMRLKGGRKLWRRLIS